MQGTAASEEINGYETADTITGQGGNDLLRGRGGNDTYVLASGFGQDTISDWGDASSTSADRVQFASTILPANITVSRSGDDLILASGPDRLTVRDQFRSTSSTSNPERVEWFDFTGGVSWSAAQIDARLLQGTAGVESISGYETADTLRGFLGNDTLDGRSGSDTYVYAAGDGADIINENTGRPDDVDRLQLLGLNPPV